jgi:LEA14-like dessication related protein
MLPRLRILWLSTAAVLSGCSLLQPHFKRPDVTVVAVEMRKGNFLQQDFAVKLHVENPNERDLPVLRLEVRLSVAGDEIASGVSDHPFAVPARGDAEFDLTVTANLALALLKLGNKLNEHADSIDYQVDGAASIDLPFLRNLPFHQTGSLSLKN